MEGERDPFTGFLFRLSLGDIQIAGFSECTGLELETKVFEYREGGVNSHMLKFPDQGQLRNIVMKRGVTSSYDLFDWYMDVALGQFSHKNQRPAAASAPGYSAESREQDTARKISIALVDAKQETKKEWLLRRAFPVKWVGPEFKASDSGVCFESIELAHEGIRKLVR